MTVAADRHSCLIDNNENVASILLRNIPNSKLECENHTPFMTKTAKQPTLWGRTYLYSLYHVEYPATLG